MKDSREKRESNLSQSLRWGSVLSFLTECRFVDCGIFFFFLNTILFTQLVRLLKGKLGKRSGHLLITYSSSVLLQSLERSNRLGRDYVIKRFEGLPWWSGSWSYAFNARGEGSILSQELESHMSCSTPKFKKRKENRFVGYAWVRDRQSMGQGLLKG